MRFDAKPGQHRTHRVAALPCAWLLLFASAMVCPAAWGQKTESTEPFFAVSSRQTYSPSQSPKIWVQFRQIDRLDFRVYRVKDPIRFFAKLHDAHSFGGMKQELAREKTLLERFHAWKRDLRLSIRDFFRQQLRFETRLHYHQGVVQQQKVRRIPLDVTSYAQVPLLNREQLALGWGELLPLTREEEFQEIPVDLHEKGLFLVEAAHRELRAYTLLMITDLALVSKSAPGQILLYVADRSSGAPLKGATTVIFNNHQELARGNTDSTGVFVATFEQIKVLDAVMVALSDKDVAATSMESFFFYDTSAREYVGAIYTDRPVYRPTHEVSFKGIIRSRHKGEYAADIPGPVNVEVTDPNQKTVYRQKLDVSPFGTFHGKLSLSPLASLGSYQIVARMFDRAVYGSFEVGEYKKPEFEVTVTTDKPRYLEGESIQATLNARYYFGAPVSNARVKYSVYRSRYFFPYWRVLWGMEEYEGEEGEGGYGESYGEEISQSTGQLDADGILHVTVPTEVDSKDRFDYRYRIEAHVTDASNREILGGRSVLATYSTVAVFTESDRYVYRQGEQAHVTVYTMDYDFQPVSTTVQLSFETGRFWDRNAPRTILIHAQVTTDAKGVAHYDYTVPNFIWVQIRATARDQNGREARFETSLWVSGAEVGGWMQVRRLEIYPDKRVYKPGETAHVLIVTNEPGSYLLVTKEGQQVSTWALHHATGGSLTVDIPIEKTDEPNFFLGVTSIKNEQFFEATKDISVPATERVLKVTVETDKPQYRPDEKVTYTITAQDEQGRPVSAELSLGVVDEAIYAIRPDNTPPLEKIFYGKQWNRVFTRFSTTYWFVGYSGRNRMELTSLRPPTTSAAFKNPSQVVAPKVRKYFPDTIYWAPTVVTDSSGRARTAFTFPDSLTTWRATARAISRDTLVGQVTQKTVTRKNLILRLEIPRFLTQGDTATITGIVHNYLDSDKVAQVSLEAQGVELTTPAATSVQVSKNGESTVAWTVRAAKMGEAKFLAKALTDEESDALELTAPVRPWGLQAAVAKSGSLAREAAETATNITLPTEINPDAIFLRIDLSPSLTGTLFSALDFLTSYPYGCVEQTMSSFLPNILVSKAVRDLGLKPPATSAELEKKIAAGLQRLYQFQHEDGGWGWWETDVTHPFMTAYVVAGLAQAKALGYPVDEKRLERGRESLKEQIQKNPRALADIRAYLLYALGSSGDLDRRLLDALYQDRDKLSPHGEALMALLLAHLRDGRAREFVGRLEKSAKTQGPYAWWRSERQEMLDFSSDNSFETTAYAVKALSDLDPKSELLPKAVRWLIDRRTDGYYWISTEQTAMAIYGLIDYLKISGEMKPDYALTVSVNGKKAVERRISEQDVVNPLPIVLTLNAPAVHSGANQIRIEKRGAGVLYWSAFVSFYEREPRPAPVGGMALNLVRQYFKLEPERQEGRIVYSETPLQGEVQTGDTVVVRLTVSSTQEEQYLEIEDPIPAGFEFIEQENLYELKTKPDWWDFYYTRREFHDDRAALFSTAFSRGQGQFHYLLKAVTPGSFQANPARVLPMYEPARQASTKANAVTIKSR